MEEKSNALLDQAVDVLALAVRELGAENRLIKLLGYLNSFVIISPILALDNAITEFKKAILADDDNEPYDSFLFLLARFNFEAPVDQLTIKANQVIDNIKKDTIHDGLVFEVSNSDDLLLFILRLYSFRIIEKGKTS